MNQTPKIIEIIVNPKGDASVQTKGFTGSSCREATKFLEQTLGEKTHEKLTSEFYEPQPVHRHSITE